MLDVGEKGLLVPCFARCVKSARKNHQLNKEVSGFKRLYSLTFIIHIIAPSLEQWKPALLKLYQLRHFLLHRTEIRLESGIEFQ